MNIISVDEINENLKKDPRAYIEKCCRDFDGICADAVAEIAKSTSDRPIILLSGPSGSGKTTTAFKLEEKLDSLGCETHTISMDNYFLPKDRITVYDENNQIDYESPLRIDIPLLQEHMLKIANCEEVDVPYFDFVKQDRAGSRKLKRKKGEIVLFEGIHALNPEVTGDEKIATCIYVSVRTRIQLQNGRLLHPKFLRLMRRIVRDRNFRNRCPAETLDMFDSVQRGEEKYINPYKYRSHFDIDSFQGFEPALFKPLLNEDFEALENTYVPFDGFEPLAALLAQSAAIGGEFVPPTAIAREFIGESGYSY